MRKLTLVAVQVEQWLPAGDAPHHHALVLAGGQDAGAVGTPGALAQCGVVALQLQQLLSDAALGRSSFLLCTVVILQRPHLWRSIPWQLLDAVQVFERLC